MGDLKNNIQLVQMFLKATFLVLNFSYHIMKKFLMLSVIMLADNTNLYSKCHQASDLQQHL